MKGILVVAIAAAALVALTACGSGEEERAAPAAGSADAVVAKIVASMGGEKALAGVNGLRATYTGTYRSGPMESPYEATTCWKRSGALRWEMTSEAVDGMMGVADGGTPWSAFMAPVARARGPIAEYLRGWLTQWDLFLVQPLLARKDVTLSIEGDSTLVASFPGGDRFELGYAASGSKTFLTSMRGTVTQMDGAEGRMEVQWSEPKLFGDITLPSKAVVRTYAGDELREEMDETITGVAWNPEFPAGTFDVPAPEIEFDKPALAEIPAATGVVFVHKGPYDKLNEAFGRVMAVVAENGLMPVGGVVTTYLDDPSTVDDPANLRTEIFIPAMLMGPPPELPEGYSLKEVPAMTVASMSVKGEYGTVEAAAIPKVAMWMGQHGHALGGPPRVVYYHEPTSTVPEDQVSEVQIPVAE